MKGKSTKRRSRAAEKELKRGLPIQWKNGTSSEELVEHPRRERRSDTCILCTFGASKLPLFFRTKCRNFLSDRKGKASTGARAGSTGGRGRGVDGSSEVEQQRVVEEVCGRNSQGGRTTESFISQSYLTTRSSYSLHASDRTVRRRCRAMMRFRQGHGYGPPNATGYLMRFVLVGNLLGLPAISIPIGHDKEGLPIGLQLIGRPWGEATILRVASAVEEICYNSRKRPSTFYDVLKMK